MVDVSFNDIYPSGGKWEDRLNEDEKLWWDEVVAIFIEDGRRPSNVGVRTSYRKNFPDGENEPTEASLRRAMDRAAKEAGVTLR